MKKYRTDYFLEGSSNYALNLVLNDPDLNFCKKVMNVLNENQIEYRRGSAGGGNQMRQPYLKGYVKENEWKNYP